jgi:site-specific DNA recombinase
VEADRVTRPIRSETRARLVEAIAKARQWLDELLSGQVRDTHEIAARESCSERSVRMTLNLAFLSPAIIQAAIESRLPHGVGLSSLADAPLAWNEQQRSLIGASS